MFNISMNNQNKYYKTSSLSLASAIQATSTSKLEFIDFSNPSRAEFVFDRTKDASFDEIIASFWTKNLPIDASTYSIRYIKSRLYEDKS